MLSLLKRFHNSSWTKRILSLCLALAMVFALLPAMSHSADALAAGDTVYLKPNSNWTQAGARFAIYYFGAGEKWVDMADSDGDGIYESVIPTGGYTGMIFCRMNPAASANNWNNKWNQTADLTPPTDGTNLYTVKAGTWDKGGGTWSTFEGVVEPEPVLTPPAAGTTLYFKPGSQWGSDAARYAAYFFDSNNNAVWVDLTDTDGDGYFEVVIPAGGYTTVIFCRMDGTILENSWDAKFNQTLDLPLDENYNCFTMDDATQWETSADGTWSVYTPSGSGGNEGGEGGETTPAEYCLVGYINGADDGNGDDYASTNHKFVNGSLTMTFTETSYVFVKTTDNANWYMTQTFVQGTTATLYNTTTGAMEKMQVPAGEVTFTLVENSDGTLTLSYTVVGGGNTGGNEGGEGGETVAGDYYLFGYINRADYGVGDDYATLGKYGFDENGKLTTSFVADSYVGVKSADLSCWYQTDGWKGSVTSATLIDSNYFPNVNVNTLDKLFVPGGVEITFTLTVNNDHTVTLSYEADTLQIEDTSGIQNGVTLHAWNWSFAEIEAKMADIAAQGYTAIQTSPIQPAKESTNDAGDNVADHWWVYYQPVDFIINTDTGNALGTKTELISMIETAHEYGIKVIVDVVANHLGNNMGNDLDNDIPSYLRNDDYWHDITQNTSQDDYAKGNRTGITQKCMGGLPDLNTANKELQNIILGFLKECIDAGVDGFRFDATKHIEAPTDDASIASDFWPYVVGGAEAYAKETRNIDLYCYGEVLDEPGGMLPISAYTPYVAVTDNSWGNTVRGNVAGGNATINSGYNKVVDPAQLILWAESHDTYADGSSSGVSVTNINKTWALVAARADAMPLYFARPASTAQALGVASVTGWANAEVKAVNKFHTAFAGTDEVISVSNKIIYVERGTNGVILVNVGGTSAKVSVAAKAMADGTYTDQITGNTFTVSNGTISGSIGSTGIAVVYTPAVCQHTNTTTTTVEATCTEDGSITVTCDDCGETVSTEVIKSAGHSHDNGTVTTKPTCSEEGVMTYTCATCGDTYTESIPTTDHSYNAVVTAPTCTEGGYTTYTCTVCGDTYTADEVAATGHNSVNGTCTICGVTTEMTIYFQNNWLWTEIYLYYWNAFGGYGEAWPGTPMEFYANDGTYDVYKLTIPTNIAGFKISGIKNDGTGERDGTPDITSDWYDGICYYMTWADGNSVGYEDIDVIVPPACPHSYTAAVTAPTCTTAGYTTYTCSLCGDTYVADQVAALGHSYDAAVTDPTCTEGGYTTYTCSVCGDHYTADEVAATGHDLTYTNNGNDHTVTCANGCGYDVTEGHTFVDGVCDCGAIEPVEETITVYAINSSNWSTVNAYVWCSVGTWEVAWPGTAMTKTGESVNGFDVYTYTFDASYDQLIFNNNSGSQTPTLEVMDGKYYDIKTATWYDSLADVPAIDPLATGVYVVGEFNGWSTLANEFKKAEATDTVATLTLELDAETPYQFKIFNNSAWTSCSTAITGDVTGLHFTESVSGNATITTVAAGTYTFTYDLVNNTLSVTYPEVIPAGPTEIELKFYHSMSFDADLKVNFRLALDEIGAVIPNYVLEGAYLELEKDRYTSGGEKTVDETTITYTVDEAANRLVFPVVGIQSVEMGSELRAVLHIFDNEGKEYVTQVDTYSVLAYVTNNLAKNDGKNNEFCTLLVDALNYGAAAQIFFDRRTDELVNAGIDAYQHYATQSLREELTASKETVTTQREITAVSKMNFSMSFDEMTKMNVKLTLTGDYTKSDITAVKVFRADGTLVETITDFELLEDGRLQVTFTGVKSIMMRDTFYFEAYVGEQLASDRYGYSMEAYAKSNVNSTNTEFGDMVLKCTYYGDSAASYFQGN